MVLDMSDPVDRPTDFVPPRARTDLAHPLRDAADPRLLVQRSGRQLSAGRIRLDGACLRLPCPRASLRVCTHRASCGGCRSRSGDRCRLLRTQCRSRHGCRLRSTLFIVRRWPDRDVRWRAVLGSTAIVLTPACLLIYGRTVTGDQAESYGGTTVRGPSRGRDLRSGSPEQSAGRSVGVVHSDPRRDARDCVAGDGRRRIARRHCVCMDPLVSWPGGLRSPRGRHLVTWAFVLACVTFLFVAVALQAITVKVQDEVIELGYVYTSYCVGAAVVSLGLAAGIRSLVARREYWGFSGRRCSLSCSLRARTAHRELATVGTAERIASLTVNYSRPSTRPPVPGALPSPSRTGPRVDGPITTRSAWLTVSKWSSNITSTSRSAMALLARRDDVCGWNAREVPRCCINTTSPFVDRASAGCRAT